MAVRLRDRLLLSDRGKGAARLSRSSYSRSCSACSSKASSESAMLHAVVDTPISAEKNLQLLAYSRRGRR